MSIWPPAISIRRASRMEALIAESPDFAEAHATLATVYYRLHRSADGDRERALSQKLMDQRDAILTGGRPR